MKKGQGNMNEELYFLNEKLYFPQTELYLTHEALIRLLIKKGIIKDKEIIKEKEAMKSEPKLIEELQKIRFFDILDRIPEGQPLYGWKAIAKHLGIGESTARYYGKYKRLPVYHNKSSRKNVWAFPSELNYWIIRKKKRLKRRR